MKKVLIINAHQKYEGVAEGKLNQSMVDFMEKELKAKGAEVKLTVIEKGYDAGEEADKHVWADIIIAQSPVYWFGTPWIHKKYIDEVFTAGLMNQSLIVDDGRTRKDPDKQYGTGGKMQGKTYMLSLTWNAPREAFGDKEQKLFAGKTAEDVFTGNTAAYKFCGAKIAPCFNCYDVMKNPQVEEDMKRMKKHLDDLIK